MRNLSTLFLAVGRKMLIPALAALGGFIAGVWPAQFSAFCGGL